MRIDQRQNNELRPVSIELNVNRYAEGSAMVRFGNTHVLCTASVEQNIPKWLYGQNKGWVTAEYGMLPRSTHERMSRDKIHKGGRTQEISRLIARSLRGCINLHNLGERQISVDCDVIQADGGTRTAAITGGFVALAQALNYLKEKEKDFKWPITHFVSAISVGINEGQPQLDLCYQEDFSAETDANFVMNDKNEFIEIQGTAEERSFSKEQLDQMMGLAQSGCQQLFQIQKETLTKAGITF